MEVLVSIFVLSLGAMTALAMQTTALITSQQSEYQTIALRLASELADMMRLHSSRMPPDRFQHSFLHIDYSSKASHDASLSQKTCYARDEKCSNEEFLQFEIDTIKNQVRNSLPEGRIRVCRDVLTENEGVRHRWSCAEGEQMPVVIKLGWNGKQDDVRLGQEKGEDLPKLVLMISSYPK